MSWDGPNGGGGREIAFTPGRPPLRGVFRPSAYFCWSFRRVAAFIFAPLLPVFLIVVFVFHSGLGVVVLGPLALGGMFAGIGLFVQGGREVALGFTTLPWRAGEYELRDPANGRTLSVPGTAGGPFKSMKAAREFAAK